MKTALLLIPFALVPALAANFLAPEPRERHIHVESFRYGKDPAVIRANRGDRLHLTFSARDTSHSFFLEEFGFDAKVRTGTNEVEVVDPARPEAGITRTREVAFDAEPPGPLGALFSRFHFRCHVWCGPMHAFEHGTFVLWPNTLLCAALGLLVGIPFVGLLRLRGRAGAPPPPPRRGIDLLERFPWLHRLAKRRSFQFVFTGMGTLFLWTVVLTTLFGTQNSGRNLGVMLLWVVWIFALLAILIPLGGRIWCLACPLPLLGETLQRGTLTGARIRVGRPEPGTTRRHNNVYRGLGLIWPRMLTNAWPRLLVMLTLGTFTVALVAKPRATGYLLVGMVVAAAVLALVFELRGFCRYLCPINAFLGLYAKAGKLALRARDLDVCARCDVKTCLKGTFKGWGCPYGLCAEDIRENDDCGLCSECIKTCVYDNIGVYVRPLGTERTMRTTSEASLSIAMLVLALSYCVLYLGPWPAVRDWVNILDKDHWGAFGLFALGLWTMALLVVPAIVYGAGRAGRVLSGTDRSAREILLASAGALVPIGLATWIAFAVPMLFVNTTFVVQSLSDPFGWGWDILGTRSTPWRQLLPQWVPWIQVTLVLVGVTMSLKSNLASWHDLAGSGRAATRGAAPFSLLLIALSAGLIFFFSN